MNRPSIPRIVASILAMHAELVLVAHESKRQYFRGRKKCRRPTKSWVHTLKRIAKDRKREKARKRHKQQMRRQGKM